MATLDNANEVTPSAGRSAQSGAQIWLVCALFIAVPAAVVLIVKYLLGM